MARWLGVWEGLGWNRGGEGRVWRRGGKEEGREGRREGYGDMEEGKVCCVFWARGYDNEWSLRGWDGMMDDGC